ncbi:MAG: NUDIX domain-containing protein, partial [Clostridia bacterium]|nr:NUDIX domain-containing protein [Clostridia bacterium]
MQRGVSKFPSTSYKYEFPGGKIEAGESRPQALMRELREEMDFDISISEDDYFGEVHHVYPEFEITMACYLCHSLTDVFNR